MSEERIGYLTEAQATALIRGYIPAGGKRRKIWEELEKPDREAFLRGALKAVERGKYSGAKRHRDQRLQFPRKKQDCAPPDVALAQAFEAAALAAGGEEAASRYALKAQGVTDFSAGSLREGYGGGGGLLSREAALLLEKYRCGVTRLD